MGAGGEEDRGAKIVCVDPRFQRTAAVSDMYAPLRAGTDIAFLSGIIRYALETKRYHADYVKLHTNAEYIVGEKYGFRTGSSAASTRRRATYDKAAWGYEPDAKTKAYGVDPTLENPRCVFQLLKKHVDRYTPEMVERICGTPKAQFLKVAEMVTSTGTRSRVGTIMYALGWTQHSIGVQIIRTAAMLQLLLGNVGRPGGGVNALRGHSNIQGATDMGGNVRDPARVPEDAELEPSRPRDVPREEHALDAEQDGLGVHELLDQLPQVHGLAAQDDVGQGGAPRRTSSATPGCRRSTATTPGPTCSTTCTGEAASAPAARSPAPEGLISFGMNPVGDRAQLAEDGRRAGQAEVDGDGGEPGERDRGVLEGAQGARRPGRGEDPDRGLPAPGHQLRGEGRQLHQLRALGAVEVEGARRPPGQSKSDQEIISRILLALKDLYRKEPGALPEAVLNISWAYTNPANPDLAEVLKEINGKAITDLVEPPKDPKSKDPPKVLKTAGQQLDSFGQLRDDGSTSCGNWLYTGVYTEAGNNAAAPDHRRPDGPRAVPPVGVQLAGQPARHVQPRLRRRRRQALGSEARRASSGTARSGWVTCPT